jgi:hypothetical protein
MKERILLVGDDAIIQETRAILLEPLETIKSPSSRAVFTLISQPFDVVIIGQTVPGPVAQEIIRLATSLDSPPIVMAIRFPGEDVDLGVETHETGSRRSPGWIKERVIKLLADRDS